MLWVIVGVVEIYFGDFGVVVVLLMNYVVFEWGEGVFL